MERLLAKASTIIVIVQSMKVSGGMICSMVEELKFGLTRANILVSTRAVSKKASACMCGVTGKNT